MVPADNKRLSPVNTGLTAASSNAICPDVQGAKLLTVPTGRLVLTSKMARPLIIPVQEATFTTPLPVDVLPAATALVLPYGPRPVELRLIVQVSAVAEMTV